MSAVTIGLADSVAMSLDNTQAARKARMAAIAAG